MTEYVDLDRELTAANLNRARTSVEVMAEWSPQAAEAAEQAWEVCKRVGERYLEARYEHEALAAGLEIAPSVAEGDFDPTANEIENLRSLLAHCEAMLKVFEEPHLALDIILNAETDHEACTALSDQFDIAEAQAADVLMNLASAGTVSGRRKIEIERKVALHRLKQLAS
jgi:hypothetical protein